MAQKSSGAQHCFSRVTSSRQPDAFNSPAPMGRSSMGNRGLVHYTEEQITDAIRSCLQSICPEGQKKLNLENTKAGLVKVFRSLAPICPSPRDDWYKTVFTNFDTDRDGYITFLAFDEIIRQYYDHHWDKYRLRHAAVHSPKEAPRQSRPSAQGPPSSGDRPTALIAKPRPSAPQQKTDSPIGGVTLRSTYMYPTHDAFSKIFEDYDFVDTAKLGRGSSGTVQIVQHKRTNERRACKRIPFTRMEQWDLIQNEIALMKSLNHPNILRLHETYHDGQTIYLLMELCEGGQLFDRIAFHYGKLRIAITEEQVADWTRQILSATAYCHAKRILHRDIKPENILLVNNDEKSPIKVIDFGLSSTIDLIRQNQREIIERKTGVGAFIAKMLPKINGKTMVDANVKRVRMQRAGTPHYMAPEMITGEYDEKCDIFSAGVIMYQLLSGIHPFFVSGVDDERSVKLKILNDHPPTTGEAWAFVSQEAKSLVEWMLKKQPHKRCSAQEALNHPWFKITDRPKSQLGTQLFHSVFDGLKTWQNHNRLKQAVLQLLAKQLSEADITELRRKFMYLDSKGDGTISIDELRSSMKQSGYKVLEPEMQRICESLDTSGDNRIGYTEFISALLARRWNFQESQLREVFNQFDRDGEGYITNENLAQALKGTRYGQLNDQQIDEIFREIDQNNDGKVDFDEFLTLMTN